MTSLSIKNFATAPSFTRTWNRDHAAQRLGVELARSQSENNYQFSIVLVQMEGLSFISNRLGYATTDNLWPKVLDFLTRNLEAQDICCHLGEDDFVLILPATGPGRCRELADRLRGDWVPTPGTREAAISVNVGVASSLAHGKTIESLFAAADQALDADKSRREELATTFPMDAFLARGGLGRAAMPGIEGRT